MIIKDSMVVIHLAKMDLLEKCCKYFKQVIIPKKVYEEIIICKDKNLEVKLIEDLVNKGKIIIKRIRNETLIKRAYQYNIQRGEAECVALYWQEKADYLASDDNNVRKKKFLLKINIIGTPVIILKLFRDKKINKDEYIRSLNILKKIGWFSNSIIDKLLMEVKK